MVESGLTNHFDFTTLSLTDFFMIQNRALLSQTLMTEAKTNQSKGIFFSESAPIFSVIY